MKFGDRLASLRKEKGLTREALADTLKISKYTIRNYELSISEPGSVFLKQVSEFFDVSIDYLMGMTEEREKIKPYNLKASEYAHIEKYRDLDDHGKDMVDTVLTKEYSRCKAVSETEKVKEYPSLVRDPDADYLTVNAAHARTDIEIPEGVDTSDDDIMNDPNF